MGWCDGRHHKVNEMRLKWDHLQYVTKEEPTRRHYGEIPQTPQELNVLGNLSEVPVY